MLCTPHTRHRSARSSCTCGAPSEHADGRSYVFDNGFVDAADADSDAVDSGCAEAPARHKSSGTTERREPRPRTSLCGLLADYSVPLYSLPTPSGTFPCARARRHRRMPGCALAAAAAAKARGLWVVLRGLFVCSWLGLWRWQVLRGGLF